MLLKTKSLSKSFARGKNSFFAVKDVDFSISASDFVFIVGRSGSGKTTFLNLISGILDPTQGQVFFEDQDISSMNDTDKSFYRNESIGFVPQSLAYLPNLSVFDNVRVPFFLFNRDGDSEGRALSLLDLMDIAHLKNEMPQNLSGGELKRMLIARALMNSPKLLIADEPTANLDKETSETVMNLIKSVNKLGTAVLIVTHDFEILNENSPIYRMNDGELTKT
ncbi:ABC transporter ATP-binding protein [Treponema denticola]|uniref:Lipoprotein releasing system, ATP-binding protein, putative n=1 Tax=Treponema denticola (strain ATCC 35405 / DSM 14222 / CIP 103919 / JCM 8153 / KCTC 15104) TaxID=243275 RepID=Q73MJ9_TREDE|nr:ABC transporter ATP-binding protein [Treponema denticola]AAS12026.1 lipoprotein releasing system, ATP-binding protein, putative [Treponema denticola ATCC 35405]